MILGRMLSTLFSAFLCAVPGLLFVATFSNKINVAIALFVVLWIGGIGIIRLTSAACRAPILYQWLVATAMNSLFLVGVWAYVFVLQFLPQSAIKMWLGASAKGPLSLPKNSVLHQWDMQFSLSQTTGFLSGLALLTFGVLLITILFFSLYHWQLNRTAGIDQETKDSSTEKTQAA